MTINFNIIGYYGHNNIGDEQYKLSFESFFSKVFNNSDILYNLNFYDCDKINSNEFNEDDVIILGGGDILNDYFLDKIISKFKGTSNKIIAVSVGLPYPSVLTDTNKINIIDYIILRTKQDLSLFENYFHQHRIMYLPDISLELILNIPKPISYNNIESDNDNYSTDNSDIIDETIIEKDVSNFNKIYNKLKNIKLTNKLVCITLNRHIHKSKNYNDILNNITQFVKFLTNFNYHVVFVPFNTNNQNPNENDILIHQDVIDKYIKNTWSSNRHITHLTNINFELSVDQTLLLFELMDFSVPMRFHACLFSIYKNVPFFPIFTTRKIKNLLVDIDWLYGYELYTDTNDLPKTLDLNILIKRFAIMLNHRENTISKLKYINLTLFGKEYSNKYDDLKDILLINMKDEYVNKNGNSLLDKKINEIFNSVQEFAKIHNFDDFRKIIDNSLQDIIVSIVSYNLTNGLILSKYNYGLKEKMFNINYDYKEEWKWIYINQETSHKVNTLLSNSFGVFDIGFVDQEDYSGCHRSGWQYVYENIKYLHNDKSNLLLDLYIDRTFHWNKEINKALKLIPYKKDWIGVIHHTFDTSFSDFNCHVLLETPEFLESLKTCKGLIVLSRFLALKLKQELSKLGHNINIVFMTHPTDHNVEKFTISKFLKNSDKKLIHIGGWLRNIYSFYNLSLPKTLFKNGIINVTQHDFKLRKVALKGKNMNNYYPQADFNESLFNSLITKNYNNYVDEYEVGNISNVGNACTNFPIISTNLPMISSNQMLNNSKKITNNWYKHFYNDVFSKLKTIDILEYTNNEDYDKILTENVVFINLVDASAVNTIIECIVRNTPIIVNKHPAVVELLGENYPLYFDNDIYDYYHMNKKIEELLKNGSNIKKAHIYLNKLNKNKFMIQNFVFALINVVQELTK